MIKKILIGIVFFLIGVGIAIFVSSFFRKLIQDLFQWTTSNGIHFGGKDFYLFGSPVHFVSFGLALFIFSIANRKAGFQKIVRNTFVLVLLFAIALVVICALDAHLKIVGCTACKEGSMRLGYGEISYGFILATSAILAVIPSGVALFKTIKKLTNSSIHDISIQKNI